jgi:hypothetical protein
LLETLFVVNIFSFNSFFTFKVLFRSFYPDHIDYVHFSSISYPNSFRTLWYASGSISFN